MRVFCLVAELKSFKAAADRLGMSTAMTSKHVMHLERRLATRLLNRTSRHVSLSEAGALYFEQSHQMLEALDEVEATVAKVAVVPRGTLKLSAPVWLANPAFVSLLADYRALYPDVRFDIDLSGRTVNLIDEGFDLALRATQMPDEGLVARRLSEVPFHLVAAPAYLDRFGRPGGISELEGHKLLMYQFAPGTSELAVTGPQGLQTAKLIPVLQSANETLLRLAVLEGMGLAYLPKWLITQDLATRRVELILPDLTTFQAKLFGVYPSRQYLAAKVRTFLDFMAKDERLK